MEKKIYKEPRIKVLAINNENLLAALSGDDKHDEFPDQGEGQFSKENRNLSNSSAWNAWGKEDNED